MIQLDPQQSSVVSHGKGPLLVTAVAGAGKTTAIVHRIARLVKSGQVKPEAILATTFTRKAAGEMNVRLKELGIKKVRVGTFHSVCFDILRADGSKSKYGGKFRIKGDLPLTVEVLNELGLSKDSEINTSLIKDFVSWCKNWLISPKKAESRPWPVKKWAQLHRIEDFKLLDKLARVYGDIESWRKERRFLTFDDILYQTYRLLSKESDVLKKWQTRYRYVIVDEFQDSNKAQYEIMRMLAAPENNLVCVGDDDQCHPPGVKVRLADGSKKRIEDLDAKVDLVKAWNRNAQKVAGNRKIQVAARPYSGKLFTMKVGKRSVPMTPNHRLLVRWGDRFSKTCVTYMMWRKGFGFRVGWCQLFNSEGAFHLGQRARIEKADRIWILKVHESRTSASVYERIVAAKFGLPTVTFEPVAMAAHLTEDSIHQVFSALEGDNFERGRVALKEHDQYFKYPFYPFPNSHTGGVTRGTYFETFACNLLPGGMMKVPMPNGQNHWRAVDTVDISKYKGPVYSLDVEKDHNYIANGVVVLNSIYSWRAAVPKFMLQFEEKFKARVIRMERNYRSLPGITTAANNLIAHNVKRLPKRIVPMRNGTQPCIDLHVYSNAESEAMMTASTMKKMAESGKYDYGQMAVLYRTNRQSDAFQSALTYHQIPFVVIGGMMLYDYKVVKDILAYLQYARSITSKKKAVKREDREAFFQILNTPSRKLGPGFAAKVAELSEADRITMFDAVGKVSGNRTQESGIESFDNVLSSVLRQVRKQKPPCQIIEYLVDSLDYVNSVSRDEKYAKFVEKKMQRLIENSKAMETTEEFLDYIEQLYIDGGEEKEEDEESKVKLLTVHKSKGLEFPVVFVPGWIDGIMPHNMSKESGDIEEERRLAYVAITRAKDLCYLSRSEEAGEESPFIVEAKLT